MENRLNIEGLFGSEQELYDLVKKRRICYDFEPYYKTDRGQLVQIGFQLNIYGTFPEGHMNATPDDPEFSNVLGDIRRVAEALSNTCDPLHMCEATIIDSCNVTYAHERKMRPDVTVHVPVFDQQNYGHPVDDKVRDTLEMAGKMLEGAGVQKDRWEE